MACATACVALSCCLAVAAPTPPAKPSTTPAKAAKPAAAKPAAAKAAGASTKPIDIATRARVFEEQGAYASALAELRRLRSVQGPDADVELAVALDEARVGLID
jgi:hypothetical protein